jgi:hypothetical protein
MNKKVALLDVKKSFTEELDVLKIYGNRATVTDFAILLGAWVTSLRVGDTDRLEDRTSYYWTLSSDKDGDVFGVMCDGIRSRVHVDERDCAIRPTLLFSSDDDIIRNTKLTEEGYLEVEYGSYPQQAVGKVMADELEDLYRNNKLKTTGMSYTTDSQKYDKYAYSFTKQKHIEYEYDGKRYVRVKANLRIDEGEVVLANGESCANGDFVWVEVQPIKWLVDNRSKTMISKKGIVSGIKFDRERGKWKGDFKKTVMHEYLQTYLLNEMNLEKENKLEKNKSNEIVDNSRYKNLSTSLHPTLYAFLAYKSKDTSDINSRKVIWDLASKIIYETNDYELLVSILGYSTAKELATFCKQKVISVKDIINDNYDEEYFNISCSQKYATIAKLINIDYYNLEKVRNFVIKLGKEYVDMFDMMWCGSDQKRQKKIENLKEKIEDIEHQKRITKSIFKG